MVDSYILRKNKFYSAPIWLIIGTIWESVYQYLKCMHCLTIFALQKNLTCMALHAIRGFDKV